jgi:hypothetical protein
LEAGLPEDSLTKVTVRVRFPDFEEAPAIFANHISIQSFGDVHVLAFYAALPPQVGKPNPDETIEIPATCVARVAIPADRMIEISKAIAANVDRTKAMQQPPPAPPEGKER